LCGFNCISIDLVFFGEVDALLEFAILSVEIGCDSSELEELMVLSSFGEVVGIDIRIFLNRLSQ